MQHSWHLVSDFSSSWKNVCVLRLFFCHLSVRGPVFSFVEQHSLSSGLGLWNPRSSSSSPCSTYQTDQIDALWWHWPIRIEVGEKWTSQQWLVCPASSEHIKCLTLLQYIFYIYSSPFGWLWKREERHIRKRRGFQGAWRNLQEINRQSQLDHFQCSTLKCAMLCNPISVITENK